VSADLLVRILVVAASLVLVAGSTLVVSIILGAGYVTPGPDDYSGSFVDNAQFSIFFLWPTALGVVALLDAVALLRTHGVAAAVFTLPCLVGLFALTLIALRFIALTETGQLGPARGLPAVLDIAFFIALDAALILGEWYFILSDATRP